MGPGDRCGEASTTKPTDTWQAKQERYARIEKKLGESEGAETRGRKPGSQPGAVQSELEPKNRQGALTPIQSEKHRQSIQVGLLIDRLTKHVMGKNRMKPTQVTAALGLLRKTLPDLAALEQKIEAEVSQISPDPVMSADAWMQQFAKDEEEVVSGVEMPDAAN
jgi:hypothetical protein